MRSKTDVRVLFLEDELYERATKMHLENRGIRMFIRADYRKNKADNDLYNPTAHVLKTIRSLTEDGDVDFVVIANNCGAGVKMAEAVAESMRGKTLITSLANDEATCAPYRAMGFTQFAARANMWESFFQLVKG